MVEKTLTWEHEGITYNATDWRWHTPNRQRLRRGHPDAQVRAFIPNDAKAAVRIYVFQPGDDRRDERSEIIARQFAASKPIAWRP